MKCWRKISVGFLWTHFVKILHLSLKITASRDIFCPDKGSSVPSTASWSVCLLGTANISKEQVAHAKQWGTPLDCTWIIRAEKGKKIYIQFPEYSLKEPNDCNFNFIQIFDEKTDIEHREKNFCGSVADEYMSETDVLFIRYIDFNWSELIWTDLNKSWNEILLSISDWLTSRYDIMRKWSVKHNGSLNIDDCLRRRTLSSFIEIYCRLEPGRLLKCDQWELFFWLKIKYWWYFISLLETSVSLSDWEHHNVAWKQKFSPNISRYFADGKGIGSEFAAFFTTLRKIGTTEEYEVCPEEEYDCDDATCISMDLGRKHK